jgi:hypothetical protein
MVGSSSVRWMIRSFAPLAVVLSGACIQIDSGSDGDAGSGGSGGVAIATVSSATTAASSSSDTSSTGASSSTGAGGAPSSGDQLYALAWDPNAEIEHVITIDAGNGTVTSVGQLPSQYMMFADCVFDPAAGRIYQSSPPDVVLAIDPATAAVLTATATSLPTDLIGFFAGGVNGAGEVLGHAWDTGLSREHIVKLDPVTGTVTSLGTLPPAHTAFTGALYDHAADRLYTFSNQGTDISILTFEANGSYLGASPLTMGPYVNLVGATVNGAGEIIGLVWDGPNSLEHVVKVDPSSGTITSLDTLPPDRTTFSIAKGVFHAGSNRIYMLDSEAPAEVFAIDASSGVFLGATPLASNGLVNPICLQALP